MDKKAVKLPELPKGKEFEEFISAHFQCGGYYVEKNIIDRKIEEVLELDLIITDYSRPLPNIYLVEAKSGNWGFEDIFKLRGWMDYLSLNKSMLIPLKEKTNIEFYSSIARQLDIEIICVSVLKNTNRLLEKYLQPPSIAEHEVNLWRLSYWLERCLLKLLLDEKKKDLSLSRYKELSKYHFKITSGIFFEETIIKKIGKLYDTFKENPLISAKCANEMRGGKFDDDIETIPDEIFKKTFYQCEINAIQISTFIEHFARLAIMKNLIDYKIYRDLGEIEKSDSIFNLLGHEYSYFETMPKSMKDGLEELSKHKYFCRYPVFWQWFMWYFGGFILEDYHDQEFKLLSSKTGIPIEEIPNALRAYQIVFPRDSGWFVKLSSSNITFLKLFPIPFMGIGANCRKAVYTSSNEYKDLNLTGEHTMSDLINWNNTLVEALYNYKS
jgi:hypothetical protein